MADEQDRAEALDADVVDGRQRGDDETLGDYPPDRLQGANQYGVTAAEESVDEPLDERISREEPEWSDADAGASGLSGTLVAPDEAPDDPQLDAELVTQEDLTPEEAALHVETDAER
jgi:hypothetical protein